MQTLTVINILLTLTNIVVLALTVIYLRKQALYTAKLASLNQKSVMASLYKDLNLYFSEIIKNLPDGINHSTDLVKLKELCAEQHKDFSLALRAIKQYIYLTYLEFSLYKENLLPQTFWEHWLKGMINGYKIPCIWEVFEKDFLANFKKNPYLTSLSEDFIHFVLEIHNSEPEEIYQRYKQTRNALDYI